LPLITASSKVDGGSRVFACPAACSDPFRLASLNGHIDILRAMVAGVTGM
jgi:hypothetical protein